MITQDQTAVIDFLASPSTHGGASVERIETHTALVFLAGTRAYKLKRAVLFDYLDFSTPERRRSLCDAEVRLNRRTAPALYRGILAVTREPDGSLALGGSGQSLLHPPGPCLLAIGGASGSGKSTLALGLAPSVGAVPGAVVLRSDEIRKRLYGVSQFERLGPEGYWSQVSDRVYATVAERARLTVSGGHSTIVDAMYVRPRDRQAIEQVAVDASVPFVGLWLEAPESTLIERAEQRRNDPSDADADVVRMQRAPQTGMIGWHRLDATMPAEIVLQCATTYLREQVRDATNT